MIQIATSNIFYSRWCKSRKTTLLWSHECPWLCHSPYVLKDGHCTVCQDNPLFFRSFSLIANHIYITTDTTERVVYAKVSSYVFRNPSMLECSVSFHIYSGSLMKCFPLLESLSLTSMGLKFTCQTSVKTATLFKSAGSTVPLR